MSEFIVCIRRHKPFNYIASAYLAKKKSDTLFEIIEPVTMSVVESRPDEFSDVQKKIIKIIDNYSDNSITKIFAKKKINSHSYIKSLTNYDLEKRIIPFIEKRLVKIIKLLQETNIKIFHKADGYNTVNLEDRIIIHENPATTVFNIEKEKYYTKYYLSAKHNDKEIRLNELPYIVLSEKPCYLVLKNDLVFFEDIDAKKLKPFFIKTHINIPESTEKKWFETFAVKAMEKYEVRTRGFEIKDENLDFKATVSFEKTWTGRYSFILFFQYGKKRFYANNKQKTFINFNIKTFSFSKLQRNLKKEQDVIDFLINNNFRKHHEGFFELNFDIKNIVDYNLKVLYWLAQNSDIFEKNGIKFKQNVKNKRISVKKINADIQLHKKKDWFDIYGTIKFGEFEIPFLMLKNNILSKNPEFILPDGTVAMLPQEWFAKYENIFAYAKEDEDGNLRLEKSQLTALENAKEIKGIDKELFKSVFDSKKTKKVKVPKGIKATLRPYQEDGFSWLYNLQKNKLGACLADDMGLGKTLQTISLLQKLKEDSKNISEKKSSNKNQNLQLDLFNQTTDNEENTANNTASIVISPVSLIHNWYNEITKFAPSLKVLIYRGSARKKHIKNFDNFDVILTSYGTIRNDYEIIEKYNFSYIILDESQYIKNPQSKIYKAVSSLYSDYKLVLTGTPVENSLRDLWSQMNFINHGILGNQQFFEQTFLYPIEKSNDEIQLNKLKRLIQPFILRRTKEQVLKELPPLSEQVIFCEMSNEQDEIYELEKSKIRNVIIENIEQNSKKNNSILIIQALLKLRQIANHPKLTDDKYKFSSGKFNQIIETINNLRAENHKVLIFSSFVKHLQLFADYFNENSYKYSMLTGETRKRESVINDFQTDKENMLFLISIKAGGTGLNLTEADYVIILDPWWNPAIERQAINRAHRIGQESKVMVYRYITKNTIEEQIKKLQEKKQELSDSILSAENAFSKLSAEDFLNLLK